MSVEYKVIDEGDIEKLVEQTDLEVNERNVVSDDFRQGSYNANDDQKLGVS